MGNGLPDHQADPLGLHQLGRIIREAKRSGEGADRIEEAYERVLANYCTLTDRYQLMKATARQLAEEVAWLRDQCDDFATERNELIEKLAGRNRDSRPPRHQRRLEDRR